MTIQPGLVIAACAGSTALIWTIFYLFRGRNAVAVQPARVTPQPQPENASPDPAQSAGSNATEVGAFYDSTNAAFVQVYGEVIQAFRTHDLANLLHYQAQMMQLKPGMRLLDAGCGICGPARFFAEHYGVQVDAVTASAVQQQEGSRRNAEAGLQDRIRVVQGDYHQLPSLFQAGDYDVVYFLESFGHSSDKHAAIASAWEMLKPGGKLYIKDLFVKEPAIEAHRAEIMTNVARINEAYRYNVGDLNTVLTDLRKTGFIISAVKTIDIPLEDFENLTISNGFQELTGIHRIDNLQAYLFPVDFFELVCIKPWYDLSQGNSRYFLQNLYYLRVTGKSL